MEMMSVKKKPLPTDGKQYLVYNTVTGNFVS